MHRAKQDMRHTGCSIGDCIEPHASRGYCRKHYERWRRHGTTEATRNCGVGRTPLERFWSRVAVTANPDRCWDWMGSCLESGYGQVNVKGWQTLAHIYSWSIANGRKPSEFVLHSCDNPRCVNPNHLREGTQSENVKDMVARGRDRFGWKLIGENNPHAKLTEAVVVEMRRRFQDGETLRAIGRHFSVSHLTVRDVVTGQTWKHVEI